MPVQWRVRPAVPVVKAVGAAGVLALALVFAGPDPVRWVLAAVAAAGLAGWALRDLLAPVRLAAGPDGVEVVHGFRGRRFLPWPAVERVRVDRRRRYGLTGALLEIDTGDGLHLFGVHDLGAAPDEVAGVLAALRAGSAQQDHGPVDGQRA